MNVKRLSKPNRLNLKYFDKLMMAHFDLITLQRKLKTTGITQLCTNIFIYVFAVGSHMI